MNPRHRRFLDDVLASGALNAIRDGEQIQAWVLRAETEELLFPLKLHQRFQLPNRVWGFFGELLLNGRPTSIMGCRQEIDFGFFKHPEAGQLLQEFVYTQFLPRAHWIDESGRLGGYTLRQDLFQRTDGSLGHVDAAQQIGWVDWRALGKEYEWSVVTFDINDFAIRFGRLAFRVPAAASVVAHAAFRSVKERPRAGVSMEVSIGFSFLPVTPLRTIFGYGPGKFGSAIKLFHFRLCDDGRLQVGMDFAATPRSRRVLDFGARVWDPVYGGAAVVRVLSCGVWNDQTFHDRLDASMLRLHARVHQTLIERSEVGWSTWLRECTRT